MFTLEQALKRIEELELSNQNFMKEKKDSLN